MSGKARQATLGGFVQGSNQKEAVPASDSGAPELDPAQANNSGPQPDSDSAQASVEGPLATLNTIRVFVCATQVAWNSRNCTPSRQSQLDILLVNILRLPHAC